jgi:mRNA interferase RelE/StbE
LHKKTWKIKLLKNAAKQLKKLDPHVKQAIEKNLRELETLEDPLALGKQLKGDWAGCYSFRVHKYRIICEPFEEYLLIEVIKVGWRKDVYD